MAVAVQENLNSIEATLFQTLGILFGGNQIKQPDFVLSDENSKTIIETKSTIQEDYLSLAIPLLEQSILRLKRHIPRIAENTNVSAANTLKILTIINSPLTPAIRKKLQSKNDHPEFERFSQAALDFFSVMELVQSELQKAANQKDNVRAGFHYMSRTRPNPAIARHYSKKKDADPT